MKKFLLICVNYKSDDALHAFVESVHRAAELVKGQLQVDIEIADNEKDNRGYLGGALPIYNTKAEGYDFVSISNVDLELSPDFFMKLLTIDCTNTGWLAPDIYTDKIDRHENPYMLTRPTKRSFRTWNIIYSYTWIYRLYYRLHMFKNKQKKAYPECIIYAGHGSFMLFTKEFVQKNQNIYFPGFMYGEEIYFAELVRAAKLKTKYEPTLYISNTGNISTGSINQQQKSAWSKESLRAIYNLFFR